MGEVRKKVAVLGGQIDEDWQRRFLDGFTAKAGELNLDVSVFAMLLKFHNSQNREVGDAMIYRVINYSLFDAVVVLADTIQAAGVLDGIEKRLREEYHGPVLYIDGESGEYPVIWTDCYQPMVALVAHLVEKCGYRRIGFLRGREWNQHSKTRESAFRDALKDHWIDADEDLFYDGDFWYSSGTRCARNLIASGNYPEAIVCANDFMAIGLCEELERSGKEVPSSVAVAGFDSQMEGRTAPKALTSVYLDAKGFGKHAAVQILRMINHQEPREYKDEKPVIFYGESCVPKSGVELPLDPPYKRDTWGTSDSQMNYLAVQGTSDNELMLPSSLEDMAQIVWGHVSHIEPVREFYMILDSAWSAPELSDNSPSDMMLCALHYTPDAVSEQVMANERNFSLFQMLPNAVEGGDMPTVRYYMPIFFENRFFGYCSAVFSTGIGGCDREYRLYMGALSRGMELLQRAQMLLDSKISMEIGMPMQGKDAQNKEHHTKRELTRDEKKEYKEAMKILDHNLFRYFFQPIVSAETGEIYSYEALMRADSALPISPLNLIRYAQMDGRLYDIERDTLMNVLNLVSNNEIFEEKKVFINSIPGVRLEDEDKAKIEGLLRKRADNVVIEITEQAELEDAELENLKERYRSMGTRIAIDDYGMGYSNAGNLLRYMPDIVKIDRALLSGIERNHQKQSFVRQIIDFCHDNGMMALAEGVETPEELRTVIRFGVDLIQGYYTARPSPEPIENISESIRSEIRRYQQERQDGSDQTVYIAGKSSRVSMSNLIKEGITHILVGTDRMMYHDVSFSGAPGQRSNIHIEVARGYEGVITLENVSLSNIRNRPCIDIGPGCHVILTLVGSSLFMGNGIRVADGSELRVEGSGSLEVRANADGYFGIGAGIGERHGKMTFSQDGEIRINANGMRGVCIGAGLGGGLEINRGRYTFIQSGQDGVCIGSFDGYEHFGIQDCEIGIDATLTNCVCIGSLRGSSDISVERSSIRVYAAAKRLAAIGTLDGSSSVFTLTDGHVDADVQMDEGTGIGSLMGTTQVSVFRAGVSMEGRGSRALLLGGYSERTRLSFDMANVRCDVRSEERRITGAQPENMRIAESRCRFIVNGSQIDFPG